MKGAFNPLVIMVVSWLAASGTIRASSIWVETGDAGDVSGAQTTVGEGNLTEIDGDIKPLGGTIEDDAFLFRYGGAMGSLKMTFAFNDPTLLPAPLALFDGQGNNVVAANRDGIVTVSDLTAGLYIVEAHSDQGLDPPYTIMFDSPAFGSTGVLFATSVPEPRTAVLSNLGLIAFAMFRKLARPARR
jgi:hypothetical protein